MFVAAELQAGAEGAGEGEVGGGREERRGAERRGGEAAWAVAWCGGGERGDGRQLNNLWLVTDYWCGVVVVV